MICVWESRRKDFPEDFYSLEDFSEPEKWINLNKIATQFKCLLPEHNQTLDIASVVSSLARHFIVEKMMQKANFIDTQKLKS